MLLLAGLLTLLAADQTLGAEAGYYLAAVVEYAPPSMPNSSAEEVMMFNAAVYTQYMANASASQVDIIVFPETGLVGRGNSKEFVEVPSPTDTINPCDQNTTYDAVLVTLSCASRTNQLYSVINIGEKYQNTTSNETEYYNTDVAFDRNGTVIGRYRKYNPYGEAVNKPATPDHHYFSTDFGVDFAMFTCFDIDFKEPAVVVAEEIGIRHFAFPVCWISELPFLTAVQAQWGWAYSLDVVLLASGCNEPSTGGTGSGIYLGRQGAAQYLQTNVVTSRMLLAQVPITSANTSLEEATLISYYERPNHEFYAKQSSVPEVRFMDETYLKDEEVQVLEDNSSNSTSSLYLLRDYLDVYTTSLLDVNDCGDGSCTLLKNDTEGFLTLNKTTSTSLCDNEFCCQFEVEMLVTYGAAESSETPRGDDFSRLFYRLAVFNGVRWYGGGIATGGVQVCGVISCANSSLASCGLRADDSSREIETYFDTSLGLLYKSSTEFLSVAITANFSYNNTFVFPDVLVSGSGNDFGALLSSDSIVYNNVGPSNGYLVSFLRIYTPVSNLVTAALYSRQFDRDGENRTEVSSSHPKAETPAILVVCFFLISITTFIKFK